MTATHPQPKAGNGNQPASEIEIELKLAADPKVLRALAAAPPIVEKAVGGGVRRRLDSVYYDTADLRLHKNHLALRVRKEGRRFVQTLKAGGDAGDILRRGEWEAAVPSLRPDLKAIPRAKPFQRLGPIRANQLHSLFASRVQRVVRVIAAVDNRGRASEIEVAFDRGVVETAAGKVPVSEIELQLRKGTPEALYRLALQLHDIAPVHVETRSKAARGYTLASGARPPWRKAKRLALAQDSTVDGTLATIVRACVEHWMANEAAAFDGGDPEGIHQMRVGLRRLRSALSLFATAIPASQLDWLAAESKWLIGSLGPARDWDVFLDGLLSPVADGRPDDPGLASLAAAGEAARAEGYEQARAAIRLPRYTRLLLRLGVWLEGHGWRAGGRRSALHGRPMVELADVLLTDLHSRVLKLGRRFEKLPPEDRHRVRIAFKKLRYAAEFFRSLYREREVTPYLKLLTRLQADLGHLNDVFVADRLLKELTAPRPGHPANEEERAAAGMVIGWHAHGVATVEPQLIADWRTFVADTPFWHAANG